LSGELLKRIIEKNEETRYWGNPDWIGLPIEDLDEIFEEMWREFPLKFHWDIVNEGDDGEDIVEHTVRTDLPYPEYKANAFVDRDELLKWVEKWMGKNE